MLLRVIYLLCLVILFSTTVRAQAAQRGQHGGSVKTTHEYQIELLACSEYYEIYISDLFKEPIMNSGMKGNIVYHYKDKADETVDLNHWGVDGFSVKGADNFTECTITLNLGGRPISATFENKFYCEPN